MKAASDIEQQAADWLARRDGDAWSAPAQQEFDAWLQASTAHRIAWLRLNSVWRRADRLSSMHTPGQLSVPAPPRRWPLARVSDWRIAATLLLACALGLLLASTDILNRPAAYETAVGENRTVALADGSRMMLNTDTRLRARLAKGRRTVWLDAGEAYFEVAHDAGRPFVVEAGDSRVTVLGTKFSVRRDGNHVSVTVVDGRVQVSPVNTAAAPAIVTRDDLVVADGGAMQVSRQTAVQVDNQLGWRQGKLILDQMTLAQAAAEFNRYNRVKLVIADPAAAHMRIGGSFNVDNVDGFARLLHQGFGLKVETGKDQIKIIP
jgi:transmembrane sensor